MKRWAFTAAIFFVAPVLSAQVAAPGHITMPGVLSFPTCDSAVTCTFNFAPRAGLDPATSYSVPRQAYEFLRQRQAEWEARYPRTTYGVREARLYMVLLPDGSHRMMGVEFAQERPHFFLP